MSDTIDTDSPAVDPVAHRPPGSGRPIYSMRLDPSELRELEAAAARAGMPTSTWLRCLALEAARRDAEEHSPRRHR